MSGPVTKRVLALLLGLPLTALSGCSHSDEAKWTEEVKIHDGTLVVIERRATRRSSDFPNPGRGTLDENELAYKPLGASWYNAERSADLILSFDIFNGVPHLVLRSAGWKYCKEHGPDTYNARFLQWKGGRWQRVPQEQFPLRLVTQNVSLHYWGHTAAEDARGLMTWKAKVESNYRRSGGPQLLTQWLDQRRQTCGQALPHLFKDN